MQEASSHGQGSGRDYVGEITVEEIDKIVAQAAHPRRLRRQLLWAVAVALLTTGAAVGSIVGQGVSYRQMRAIESISETLTRGGCAR